MRPPKDLSSYGNHIANEDGKIKVWCVECERWTEVVIIASAIVTYRQNHWPNKSEEAHSPGYHCGSRGCWADVEYLLSEADKETVLVLANVPIQFQNKLAVARVATARTKQLRMEI